MAFTGDLSKLGQFARNLGKLAAVPSRLASEGAKAIDGLIRESFATSTDPYGNAWAPLRPSTVARKYGDDRILIRTEATLDTLDVSPRAGAGIAISISNYMGFHLGGTVHMVARPPLPIGTFPAKWRTALESSGNAAFKEAFAS